MDNICEYKKIKQTAVGMIGEGGVEKMCDLYATSCGATMLIAEDSNLDTCHLCDKPINVSTK